MHDESWRSVRRELKREARPHPELVRGIVVAAGSIRRPGRVERAVRWVLRPRSIQVRPLSAGLLAAAVLLVALLPTWPSFPDLSGSRGRAIGGDPFAAARNVQFVLVAPEASRVSLVGDFNDWDPLATPLMRDAADGLWSVVVPLESGRYLYAFLVDGVRWLPDAGAPRGPESEFGGPSSVLLVEEG